MKRIAGGICAGLIGLGLAGCGGAGDGASHASSSEGRDLASACEAELNVPEGICTCIGETAAAELSSKQIEFLLAAVNDDEARTEQLRQQLSIADATEAGMFLVNAPADCASSSAGGN